MKLNKNFVMKNILREKEDSKEKKRVQMGG